ncbi:hypothetical protein QE152_g13780 [Popillia japonica]|uniref:Uncharacterized protein n=1 Tax=Popillia japonica TaxID=7064 RepID=A0AAW1LBF2_POPJA
MSQQTERDTNLKESADANLSGHYIQYHVKYAVILECHHYDPVLALSDNNTIGTKLGYWVLLFGTYYLELVIGEEHT